MPRCRMCGARGPTQDVSFNQNIGLLVVRLTQTFEGPLCHPCVHRTFWQYTLVTLFLGWWGIISFFMTPFILLFNTIVYVVCLIGMASRKREDEES
jgi:hypothetical protein